MPITSDQLTQLEAGSCVRMSALVPDADAASPTCTFSYPQIPACGNSTMNAWPDLLSIIYTSGDGTTFFVSSTSADCPTGDGYYSDQSSTLSLCPKSCAAIQQDASSTISYIAGCKRVPCIT